MYDYFHNLFLAVDQLVNTIIGGDPDETFSSRVGKCQRGDYGMLIRVLSWPLALVINVLFIWQGWRGYLGAKVYGADAPEYKFWMNPDDVYEGSQAIQFSGRLVIKD